MFGISQREIYPESCRKGFFPDEGFLLYKLNIGQENISLVMLLSECVGNEHCVHRYFYATASLFCDFCFVICHLYPS